MISRQPAAMPAATPPAMPAAALALLLAAAPALAQEEGGTVTLTIGEASYDFPLWAGQSDWSGNENYASVNIYARPTDDATWARFKTLTLGFEYLGGVVNGPELSLTRVTQDGGTEKLYGDDDTTNVVVTIDSISARDDLLDISGSLSGALGPSDDYGRTVDLGAPLSLSGSFEVTLGPVE